VVIVGERKQIRNEPEVGRMPGFVNARQRRHVHPRANALLLSPLTCLPALLLASSSPRIILASELRAMASLPPLLPAAIPVDLKSSATVLDTVDTAPVEPVPSAMPAISAADNLASLEPDNGLALEQPTEVISDELNCASSTTAPQANNWPAMAEPPMVAFGLTTAAIPDVPASAIAIDAALVGEEVSAHIEGKSLTIREVTDLDAGSTKAAFSLTLDASGDVLREASDDVLPDIQLEISNSATLHGRADASPRLPVHDATGVLSILCPASPRHGRDDEVCRVDDGMIDIIDEIHDFIPSASEKTSQEPTNVAVMSVDDDIVDIDALPVTLFQDGDDDDDDDDEELVMVSESVVKPPKAIRVDDEIEIIVNEIPALPRANCPCAHSASSGAKAKCDGCSAWAPAIDSLRINRCRHRLCPLCGVKAVAELAPPSTADAEIEGANFEVSTFPKQAGTLKHYGICPVDRCRAPLTTDEARSALVPSAVDAHFTESLEDFDTWMDAGATLLATDYQVVLPPFSGEMAAAALRVEGGDEHGEWFTDDFRGAYAPFWLYELASPQSPPESIREAASSSVVQDIDDDDDIQPALTHASHRKSSPDVIWLCAACGLPESTNHGIVPSRDPDCPPLYMHCALARAYGVVLSIHGFAEATAEKVSAVGTAATPKGKRISKRRAPTYATAAAAKRYRKAGSGFAKGTGYGGSHGQDQAEWAGLSKSFLEQTARADSAAAYWLSRIRCFIIMGAMDPAPSWPGYMRALLRNCGLMTHLSRILVNESIMDVGGRVPVFVAALRVVNAFTDLPSLRELVTETVDGARGRSIANLVDSLSKQASLLSSGAGVDNLDAKTSLLIRQIRRSIRGINRHGLLRDLSSTKAEAAAAAAVDENGVLDLDAMIEDFGSDIGGEVPPVTDTDTPVTEAEKNSYIEAMRKVQFETVPGLAEKSVYFKEAISKGGTGDLNRGAMMRRVASEVASLFSSLPLDWSSTIILRVDEDRYDFLRACICGPQETPYDSGVFVFDIYLPAEYPQTPPKFKLLTTGGGRVRFNPNLYNNGKVCLSLLGTWAGPTWTRASTLLQVLVSIQSLILVEQPYFNEPGFEASLGTPQGKASSDRYNAQVRRDNAMHAMLDNLRHIPGELRVAVRIHFRMKRRSITRMLHSWFPWASVPPASAVAAADVATNIASLTTRQESLQQAGAGIGSAANLPEMHALQQMQVAMGGQAGLASTMPAMAAMWAQLGLVPSAGGALGAGAKKPGDLSYAEYTALMTELDKL
jgi:ubiquitin-protein ligase